MRQTIRIILLFGITLSIFSCKSEPVEDLPLETQTGNNTFGCKVDGALFVSHSDIAPAGKQALSATYYKEADLLTIEAYSENQSNSFQKIFLALCHPTVNSNMPFINLSSYYPLAAIDSVQYRAMTNLDAQYETSNIVNFTRFDTIQQIVSGNFYFTGVYSRNNLPYEMGYAAISDGRFDIKLIRVKAQRTEIPILLQLPIVHYGWNLGSHEFAIVRSKSDLSKVFSSDYLDRNSSLFSIDFSKYDLLAGHLLTSYHPIVYLESKFWNVSKAIYQYQINVSVGILCSFDGCYHGIVVPKLPDNSTIVVDVVQK